ncbi:MAG TPA: glycosyltransferase family 2 protein, partial [Nocardioides sp.]|nr:glycosyltransferase family 2 protein [Nocardioides sp.]
MGRLFRRAPLVGVVIPAWGVERYLDECVRSLVAQRHRRWEAVIVDDGSTDRTGDLADAWAARDHRISVVHQANAGLGAARNAGLAHVRGDYLAFLDSDDLLQPTAFADLVGSLEESGSDFATGSILTWLSRDDGVDGPLVEPPWMKRLHHPPLRGARIEQRPELLGDVFAWNKLFRRSWWDEHALTWPEGVRYEDQPTTTRAFLAGTFDVLAQTTYRWRVREGSITQTRASSVQDLSDRWETKRQAVASVRAHGSAEVEQVFVDRVLAGDLWRYFLLVPGAPEEWWRLLRAGVLEFWGRRSLV